MLNRTASLTTYRVKTIETADPMTADDLEELTLKGWRHVRTLKRTSRQGRPYLVHEFESNRPQAGQIENRSADWHAYE